MPIVCTALAKAGRVRSQDVICTAAIAASLALGGCAKAISADGEDLGTEPDAGLADEADADVIERPDAAPDPEPTPVTLTHSASNVIEDESSFRCGSSDGSHAFNGYYRVFDLEAMGVVGDVSVESVSIGIQEAITANDGSQPATVKLHTLEGDFLLENLTELASVTVDIPEQTLSVLEVPVTATVPANSVLVLEVQTPDGDGARSLWLGANNDGQTGPSYLLAPAEGCGYQQPTNVAAIGVPDVDTAAIHWVMSVSGTAQP